MCYLEHAVHATVHWTDGPILAYWSCTKTPLCYKMLFMLRWHATTQYRFAITSGPQNRNSRNMQSCFQASPRGEKGWEKSYSQNVIVKPYLEHHCRIPGTHLVSFPDLIRCVYHFQYNAHSTESDPRWGWFGSGTETSTHHNDFHLSLTGDSLAATAIQSCQLLPSSSDHKGFLPWATWGCVASTSSCYVNTACWVWYTHSSDTT